MNQSTEDSTVEKRVQKLISESGFCSRRKAEEKIEQGLVTVNGNVITLGDKATKKDIIIVEGTTLTFQDHMYLAFHKPVGCVTALKDPKLPTIMKYITIDRRVYPIGRLDYNTSGLLLLTTDGDFAQRVSHPSNATTKTYKIVSFKPIAERVVQQIKKGVKLEDGLVDVDAINQISKDTLTLSIHDGRNRIIRRLCKEVGIPIRSLKRTHVGNVRLGNLQAGKTRPLSQTEIGSLNS